MLVKRIVLPILGICAIAAAGAALCLKKVMKDLETCMPDAEDLKDGPGPMRASRPVCDEKSVPEKETDLEKETGNVDASEPVVDAKEADDTEEPSVPQREYVCNNRSHVFHERWCPCVDRLSEKNRAVVTCSREELLAAGYAKCDICDS